MLKPWPRRTDSEIKLPCKSNIIIYQDSNNNIYGFDYDIEKTKKSEELCYAHNIYIHTQISHKEMP